MSELTDEERDTLRKLHRKAFGDATLYDSQNEWDDDDNLTKCVRVFAHPTEESAMVSAATNRVVYGHAATVEQIDGQWCSRVEIGVIPIHAVEYVDPIRYVLDPSA